jgi:two-component system, NarL family, sensor histidine kinase EvgS
MSHGMRTLILFLLGCVAVIAPGRATPQEIPYESLNLLGRSDVVDHHTVLSNDQWQWLREKETLVLGTYDPDLPPLELVADGKELEGVAADYISIISRELGIKIVVHRFSRREDAFLALAQGDIDMLNTISYRHDQEPLLTSIPYMTALPVAFQRAGNDWIDKEDGFKGKTVVYNPRYVDVKQLQEHFPDAIFKEISTSMKIYSDVAFGHADIGVSSSLSAYYTINKHYPNELKITHVFNNSGYINYTVSVSKKNSYLLKILNKAIKNGISTDQKNIITQRWSGGGITREKNIDLDSDLMDWIKNNPVIRVGVAENFPPFSYYGTDEQYYGITADFLAAVSTETGLRVKVYRYATIGDLFKGLADNKIDMVADVSPSQNRRKLVSFTRPYLITPMALIVRDSVTGVDSFEKLNGKVLIIPNNHVFIPYIEKNYPKIKMMKVQDVQDAFKSLSDGKGDALLQPLNTARYYIFSLYENKLKISTTFEDKPAVLAFAMNYNKMELRDIIDRALLNITPNETSVLNNRWFSRAVIAPQSWRGFRSYIYQAIVVASVLLSIFIAWNVYLIQQIKKRKHAEHALGEQLKFMDTLINGTPHPIYFRDEKMKLVMCNDSYLQTFVVEREQAFNSDEIGYGCLGFDAINEVEMAHKLVVNTKQPIIADRNWQLNGHEVTLYHWLLPYEGSDGVVSGVIGGWIDISDRNNLLMQLEAAKEQADQASRTKTTFLATMSHEIRTPLNAVLGTLELALKKPPGSQHALLEIAHSSARGLLELIGDILDIARIESGKLSLNPERTNLRQLVESVVRVFDGLARQKSLSLKLQSDPELDLDVLIDPVRLKQVLSNLVSNAIKFTQSGEVRVDLESLSATDGSESRTIKLTVSDTGVGISSHEQARLFQAFAQVKEGAGGAGLGLMISRSICQMMGGRLTLVSEEGVGTQVLVELDVLCLPRLSKPEDIVDDDISLSRLSILIVDDNPTNRALLAYQLDFLGQEVVSAEQGLDALEKWKEQSFDLMITDCNMPIMNGFELTKKIRLAEQQSQQPPIVIIGLTANAQLEVRDQCLASGMNGCLFKPVELDDLHQALQEIRISQAKGEAPVDIDISQLMQTTGGNIAIIDTLLMEMLNSTRMDMVKLSSLSNDQSHELDALAHRIKGAAKVLKAEQLIQHCEALEGACRVRDVELVAVEQEELCHYLARFCDALQHKLAKGS